MKKYFVTLEFPPPYNARHGEVTWEEVEARTEREAEHKARLKAMRAIRINKIKEIKP